MSVLALFLIVCHVRCAFVLLLRLLGFVTDSRLFPNRFRIVSESFPKRFRFVPDLPLTAHSRSVSSLLLSRFFMILWEIGGFSWEVLGPASLTYDFIWEVFRFTISTSPFTACWEDPRTNNSNFLLHSEGIRS